MDDSCYPHILVSGVELCVEDGGGETETEVHIAGGNVPQHHVPVSGGAEELSATTTPAEADTQQKNRGVEREREQFKQQHFKADT